MGWKGDLPLGGDGEKHRIALLYIYKVRNFSANFCFWVGYLKPSSNLQIIDSPAYSAGDVLFKAWAMADLSLVRVIGFDRALKQFQALL